MWNAGDTRLGRIAAIKKVREQHSERFKREARSIAALNRPNICPIHLNEGCVTELISFPEVP